MSDAFKKDAFDDLVRELEKLPRAERIEKLRQLRAGLKKDEKRQFEKRLWFNAVHRTVHDHTDRHQDRKFTRTVFHREELARICEETETHGKTPEKTLDFYMQELRKAGIIEFVDNHGTYRLLAHDCDLQVSG